MFAPKLQSFGVITRNNFSVVTHIYDRSQYEGKVNIILQELFMTRGWKIIKTKILKDSKCHDKFVRCLEKFTFRSIFPLRRSQHYQTRVCKGWILFAFSTSEKLLFAKCNYWRRIYTMVSLNNMECIILQEHYPHILSKIKWPENLKIILSLLSNSTYKSSGLQHFMITPL